MSKNESNGENIKLWYRMQVFQDSDYRIEEWGGLKLKKLEGT